MNSPGSNGGSSTGSIEGFNSVDLQQRSLLSSNRVPGQPWPQGGPRRGKRTGQHSASAHSKQGDVVRSIQLHPPAATHSDEVHQVLSGDEICMETTSSTNAALTPLEESGNGRIVTMTGTIKRGQKKGQAVEVKLQLTEDEMKKLSKSRAAESAEPAEESQCGCGLGKGPHILVFTILFAPIALILSLGASFYIGTMCWYNVHLYLSEERTIWHKIFLSPLLIIFYPFLILMSSLSIALYSAVVQLSWSFTRWRKEIQDFDKGFYGWLCGRLGISQCSPYQIVVLDEEPNPQSDKQNITQTAV